jgi:TPR repeat protein
MYEKGKGTPLDYQSAYMWWNLAAASGDENGQRNSGMVAGMMTPAVIGAGYWADL